MNFFSIILGVVLLILIAIFIYLQNNKLQITEVTIKHHLLPKSFNQYKIVHLSDLHSKRFGKNQKYLVSKIASLQPDIIVFTGDMVDRRKFDLQPFEELTKELKKIAPMYYVFGNQETYYRPFSTDSRNGKQIMSLIKRDNINLISNRRETIHKKNEYICLLGIHDPTLKTKKKSKKIVESYVTEMIKEARGDNKSTKEFHLLLSHRPELLQTYSEQNVHLVLSGHAHGGQIRIPFVGGLIAPHQGFFPKITEGVHKKDDTFMVVSRGLGNSGFPLRLFNYPEIVSITLDSTK